MLAGGRLRFAVSDSAHQSDPSLHEFDTQNRVLSFNAWEHVALVYHQHACRREIYVNGLVVLKLDLFISQEVWANVGGVM